MALSRKPRHNPDPCPAEGCGSVIARHLHGDTYRCKDCFTEFTRSRKKASRLSARPKSKAEREETYVENYGALGLVIRGGDGFPGFGCIVAGCASRHIQLAHVKTRGACHGAWRVLPDGRLVGNLVPLCERHHREQHARGIVSFEQAVNEEGGFHVATMTYEWHPETLEAAAEALGMYAKERGVDPRTNQMRRAS